jgi:aryl-alcohol dehydrogenase-like predicted oxidoreductase
MTNQKATTRLGATGPGVFAIGLGCMGMSNAYGPSNDEDGIATIATAIERGVTLLDTGDFYGMGHNEMLIRRAIEGRRDKVQLSVKFGVLRTPDMGWGGTDTRPEAVKNFAAYSLKRLGVDVIDVYRPARLDPKVPIEDTVGAIAELVQKGYVRHIGLSEVGVDTIRRAHETHPIVDLQIEYSILSRAPEDKIFPVLHELGIGATLYSVLGRGQLGGKKPGPGDFRHFFPRFSAEHSATNDALIGAFSAFAREKGMTPGQLAVSWVLAKEPRFVPVIGARTVAQLDDALGALTKPLSQSDLEHLEKLVPKGAIAGTRYAAVAMAHLDSER